MVMDKQSGNVAEEVQGLVWALVDEYATESQVRRLEELLLADEEARRTYVMCMQMHADLHFLLSDQQSRLAETIEELLKADEAAQSRKGRKQIKKSKGPMSLPLADLPSTTHDVPHSNGLSH